MSRKTSYQSKLTSPEEGIRVVKSGDLIYIPAPPQPPDSHAGPRRPPR